MKNKIEQKQLLLKIRLVTLFFMAALIVSGVTAFAVETELKILLKMLLATPYWNDWLEIVFYGIAHTNTQYPFLAYGYDWLAFAHIVISLVFIGLYREPVRDKWLVSWAMICCAAVIPLALICGEIRQIPFFWRLIDCSFGVFGIIPLIYLKKLISKLENTQTEIY